LIDERRVKIEPYMQTSGVVVTIYELIRFNAETSPELCGIWRAWGCMVGYLFKCFLELVKK